jgi:uncharacterized protein YbjT (DUF2867 family)
MKVLLLGASGLVGRHLAPALRAAGCDVVCAGRNKPASAPAGAWRELDFATLTDSASWLPHLAGVDAVVNCVGIIRENSPGDFERIQHTAPVALFAACEQLGLRRVIQLSALGSAPDAATAFWRSKGAADADLLCRQLDATVVRLSLVYAADGASSRLFLALASMPLLALPMARRARVQPIHIDDLTSALVRLVRTPAPQPEMLALVGPRPMSIAQYVAALRNGLGAGKSFACDVPLPLARLGARVAAIHPASTLTPDSLTMLVQSADSGNTADTGAVTALLGHAPRDPASFARPEQKAAAVMSWGVPLITFTFAILWLATALVSWFGWPHAQSEQWLAACGIPAALRTPALLGASLLDGAIGCALLRFLFQPRRWLWLLQLGLVASYTVVMSFCLPEFWLHPFGPLSKNLPLIAVLCVMWQLSPQRK